MKMGTHRINSFELIHSPLELDIGIGHKFEVEIGICENHLSIVALVVLFPWRRAPFARAVVEGWSA